MKIEQFLFTKLAEEAVEVAQRALKTQQFGQNEHQPGDERSNTERLHGELVDMMVIIGMLEERYSFGFMDMLQNVTEEEAERREAKVLKYMKYSQDLGKVDLD